MSDARLVRETDRFALQAGAAIGAYDLWQLPGGEAGFLDDGNAVSSGNFTDRFRKRGQANLTKATGVVLLAGQRVWWDYTNNRVNYKKTANSRDWRPGVVAEDATAAAATALVDLNRQRDVDIDIARDSFLTTIVGTQGLNTMGLFRRGGAHKLILSSENAAQKVDILGVDDIKTTAKTIVEGQFRVVNGSAGAAPDFNIGVGSATHATDADSIAEHCFLHIDGNSVNINAQSKDGTTTVASTDTTVDYTAGSGIAARVHFLMDLRDLTSIKLYLNGARVLSATTFRLDNATGPLYPLIHLEKTAAADTFEVDLDYWVSWNAEQ